MSNDLKCPRCGTVMCQLFDDKEGPHGITLAVPNGKYKCYRCGYETSAESKEQP